MQKYIITILTFILCLAGITCNAANSNFRFMHITSQDGLPHQQVSSLIQDHKGCLWIGTRNGLSRYDGYVIRSYFKQNGNKYSLNHNSINTLFQDFSNNIWIGTYSGICLYQPASDDFKCYNIGNISTVIQLGDGRILAIGVQIYFYDKNKDQFTLFHRQDKGYIVGAAVDKKTDRIYMSTPYSIYYYDSSFSKITQINSALFSDFLNTSDAICPLFFDSKGYLWVGRNGKGVMKIDLRTSQSVIYGANTISDGTVRTITEDYKNRIWIGTEKGVTVINPDGTINILQQDFENKNTLNDNAVYSIVSDRGGNIWIGTYFGGVNVLLRNNEQFHWIEPGYGQNSLRGKVVRRIVEEPNNNLWLATEDGGLNIYNVLTGNVNQFTKIPSMGHNVHELLYDKDKNNMWIGTFLNGLFCYNISSGNWTQYLPGAKSGLKSNAIFTMVKQRNGTIWIGSLQGVGIYDPVADTFRHINNPILDTDFIYCMMVDDKDNLWLGTRNNGLFHYNTITHEINSWNANAVQSGLRDNYITCLYQDSHKRVWIGTNNGGIQYVDPYTMKIISLNNGLALSQTTICSIIEDQYKRLWVSTSQGLYQFNHNLKSLVRYTVEDGLPINQFNFESSLLASNGMLYFGSVNGLISFSPQINKENRGPFNIHLSNLIINNQTVTSRTPNSPLTRSIDEESKIELSYDESRSFSIEYAAISLGNTSTINYQIRLLGSDDSWKPSERKFIGSNLVPGTYTLQIRANNSNNGWDTAPIKSLKIIINPPFYKSVWAFLIYSIVIGAGVYFAYRFSSIRLREKNEVRMANMEKDKVEELNKTKLDFFTTVSHELKTPLSLIVAPLKYISQQEKLSDDSTERLDVAIKNTNKMVGLIDELVTFNKVESGNFQFYLQQGNPLDFIESIVYLFKESAKEKSINLQVNCENNGEQVWFSPSYVERIVNNLLTNAIKYTHENGEILVKGSIEDSADEFTYFHLEVKDSGIGIVEEELKNIFTKYYQTKRGYNVNSRGWGLGLALVKRLAEIHNGNVIARSKVGIGSTFIVNLNVSESAFDAKDKINSDKALVGLNEYKFSTPQLETNLARIKETENENDNRPMMLIVEDNIELLKFLSDLFSKTYNICTAEDGMEALDATHNNPIDIVISDVMMPKMDGNELCSHLKNDIYTSHIPIILLTAKSGTDDIRKGYEMGAEAYVAKPFDPQILELQVKNILRMRQSQREEIVKDGNVDDSSLSKLDKDFINKINTFIDENIENEDFSIVDITKNLGVSRSLLHLKMKSLLHISAGDYIRKKRFDKACALLKDGYKISEAAYMSGFVDPSYFSRSFKKKFGVTPTEYLNNKSK